MTAKYFAILTNYGAAQLANAVALGTQMNISAMAVGDGGGTLPVPDPAQTKLVRETRRAAVNQVSIDEKNPNFIIAEQVIPENEGGWFIREIGLFDDKGGLVAVGNAPETYKPNLQEGSGRTQVVQMVLMVSSTQAITLKVDPSVVLATREYVTKSIDAAIQASEARAAKTYQPIGDYVLNPFFKLEMLKKIDKADISQQLGNDTGKVVSQHLLTTEIGKLQPKGDYAYKSDLSTKRDVTNTIFKTLSYQPYDTQLNSIWFFTNEENADWRQGIARNRDGITGYSNFRSDHSGDVAHTNELFGFGQKWYSVRNERQTGVTYRNNTKKAIVVSYFVYSGKSAYAIVDGVNVVTARAGQNGEAYTDISATFIVPPDSDYSITGDVVSWSELR